MFERRGSSALGAFDGAAIDAGGYEYNLKTQKERIDEDLKNGKVDQKEYNIRQDQIKRNPLIQ